ncbi:MAG TPA: serine/threonine-protein kinase [Gemmatimonadaceae bacterium]|nr:serine/threonine-protein kinase [Gemmatimonadaceae bacterium]
MSSDLRDKLQASLGSAYRLERELGGGGMSRVFLAHDLGLDRQVVVKVISPELAAGVSIDRFRREILLAAKLQHPHIVPVLAAGEAAGLPYFTMPFIDGLSLRKRLEGGRGLPPDEVVPILRDVARALAFAHEHGVVHRDIKPDNVLLSGGSATVTDFGIAKAIVSARAQGSDTLTVMGTSLGTPTYMAPEQIAADPSADHRADLYAFGVMAYELLTGRPPFYARPPQQLLTAHLTEPPAPLTARTPAIQPALAALIMRCLSKSADERPQSAAEIVQALDRLDSSGDWRTSSAAAMSKERRSRLVLVGAIAALVLIAALLGGRQLVGRGPALDNAVVAVVPFRIASADPAHHYLREGMLDLLAAKLTGEGGLRATEPRTLLAAWRNGGGSQAVDLPPDRSIDVARDVGAGRLLLGEVVGTPIRLVLSASLLRVPTGDALARVSVEGAPDSLAWLVDRLAARLLAEVSGEGEQRTASLTGTSLAALRAYLDGQVKLRHGQAQAAGADFARALQEDSTFALAGIGLHQASSWYDDQTARERGLRLAWDGRDRLGPRDQALLRAVAGPDFPRRSSSEAILRAREGYTNLAPDRPDAWYLLGDHLFHYGQVHDLQNYRRRALDAFKRASELDSTYVVPFLHGLDLAVLLGDTAVERRFERLRLANDTTRAWVPMHRWFEATWRGDTTTANAIRDSIFTLGNQGPPGAMLQHIFYDGAGARDASRLIEVYGPLAKSAGQSVPMHRAAHDILLALGRPKAARAHIDSMFTQDAEINALIVRVRNGLVGEADSADAEEAVRALEAKLDQPAPSDSARRVRRRAILRVLEPWRLARRDTSTVRASLEELRLLSRGDTTAQTIDAHVDMAVIEAMHADVARSPNTRAMTDRLDSLMRSLDYSAVHAGRTQFASIVLARLLERQGDLRRALLAIRRRGDMWSNTLLYLPTQLREEGRLAALAGERADAIAAYRHYLTLLHAPEPQLREQVSIVREELARLESGGSGKREAGGN